ncbi:MAG: nphR 1 [Microbacterium sp.]|jgi:AraC-like DNA-binding protein|uniref:AraC family transcriptional regulator n=1 Tax=Microbacterium sp. TaxID=51671 RepID=UPI0026342557|nr:helix-turn-helix domain-containing protein [Microbacterium sp.]MDF2563466.1 nphR 1 [Microbacterium sp.]
MPNGALRRAIAAHLGPDATSHGLIGVQEYRTAVISAHRVRSPRWRWTAQQADRAVTAVVFASEGGLALAETTPTRRTGALLHSTHSTTLQWTTDALATVVWLDTESVIDTSVPPAPQPVILPRTALATGLHAFAESLVHRPEVQTRVSDYIVERLLVEMAYGVLLEHRETDAAGFHAVRPMHRARMLMLLNRADADYGLQELARDLHVSTRHLQRLFAKEGTSPAAELRNVRAELALSLLRDPQYDALTTSQIAAHAGFTNAAAMRRGLHAIGAPSPQAARYR